MSSNMKKLILILTGVMVVSFSIAGGMFATNNPKNVSSNQVRWNLFNRGNINIGPNTRTLERHDINEEERYQLEEVSIIDINSSSTSINLFRGDEDEIKVHFYGTIETNSEQIPWLETSLSNERLTVDIKRRSEVQVFSNVTYRSDLKLDIYLPETYLKELQINSSSGSVAISEVIVDDLRVRTSSGSININSIETQKTSLNASSGSIKLASFKGDLEVTTSSGSIRIDSAETTRADVRASSGAIAITNFTGELNATTSSGSMLVEYREFKNNINLRASSGAISLKLPEDANFNLQAETSPNSRVDSQFPILMTSSNNRRIEGVVGEGGYDINLQTSSGVIRIYH